MGIAGHPHTCYLCIRNFFQAIENIPELPVPFRVQFRNQILLIVVKRQEMHMILSFYFNFAATNLYRYHEKRNKNILAGNEDGGFD